MNVHTLRNQSLVDRSRAEKYQGNVSCIDDKVHGKPTAAVCMQEDYGIPCAGREFVSHEGTLQLQTFAVHNSKVITLIHAMFDLDKRYSYVKNEVPRSLSEYVERGGRTMHSDNFSMMPKSMQLL